MEYEEKLKMAKGFLNGKEKLEQALKIVNSLEENLDTIELKQLLETVLRKIINISETGGVRVAFESLGEKLQGIFKKIKAKVRYRKKI